MHVEDFRVALTIKGRASEGDHVLSISSTSQGNQLNLTPGDNLVEMEMPVVCMPPDLYHMNVVVRQGAMNIMDSITGFNFNVKSNISLYKCKFYQPRTWKVSNH